MKKITILLFASMILSIAGMNRNIYVEDMPERMQSNNRWYIRQPAGVHTTVVKPRTLQKLQDASEKGELIAQYKQFLRKDLLENKPTISESLLNNAVNTIIQSEGLRNLPIDELREKLRNYGKK